MAKEIKYFKQSITSVSGIPNTVTVYTVPSGRHAKIIINYFQHHVGQAEIKITDKLLAYSGVYSGYYTSDLIRADSASTAPIVIPNPDQAYFATSTGAFAGIYTRVWYIGPGETVTLNTLGGGGYTAQISFMVIEEY